MSSVDRYFQLGNDAITTSKRRSTLSLSFIAKCILTKLIINIIKICIFKLEKQTFLPVMFNTIKEPIVANVFLAKM